MGLLRRKQRKKPKRLITICLEKDGEIKEIEMEVGRKIGMLKIAKKLGSEGKQGWQLLDIKGDPEISGMFMGAVREFQKTGNIPIKTMVKSAGLSAVPKQIKDLLKREKKEVE